MKLTFSASSKITNQLKKCYELWEIKRRIYQDQDFYKWEPPSLLKKMKCGGNFRSNCNNNIEVKWYLEDFWSSNISFEWSSKYPWTYGQVKCFQFLQSYYSFPNSGWFSFWTFLLLRETKYDTFSLFNKVKTDLYVPGVSKISPPKLR